MQVPLYVLGFGFMKSKLSNKTHCEQRLSNKTRAVRTIVFLLPHRAAAKRTSCHCEKDHEQDAPHDQI